MDIKTYEDGAAEIDYIDLLDIPEGESGDFRIVHTEKEAGFPHAVSPVRATMLSGQPAGFVKYHHPTKWIALEQGERGVWMTDAVCEQEQHWRALKNAHGHILIGGLGVGMAVKILEHNFAVSSILVVEKSQDVIDLVWDHVCHERATVVCDDIHSFVTAIRHPTPPGWRSHYDLAFLDTWASDSEDTFWRDVVPLREAIYRRDLADEVVCWNEDVMRGQLRMSIWGRWIHAQDAIETKDDLQILSDLCDVDHESKWIRWSAPFFLAIDKWDIWGEFEEYGEPLTSMYSQMVGMPGWRGLWPIVVGQLIEERRSE